MSHDVSPARRHTIHFDCALLPGGWAENVRLAIEGGIIAAVETGVGPAPADERHAIAIPGMPNVHSHAFQRGMAGLAERRGAGDDSFWTWREIMYRFVDGIDAEALHAIAALAYVEMLETGFVRVGEFHYVHHDPDGSPYADPAELTHGIIAAAAETGIGLTHLPVFYAHSGFGGLPANEGQRRYVHDPDSFARLLEAAREAAAALPDALVGIAPHSLRAVTTEELRLLQQMAGSAPVHIHIAEQVREVDDCLAWSGRRPVEWLLDNAEVDARWCLVHATHTDAAEVTALAATDAVAGLCPVTEANLGDGLFPASAFLAAGGRFGIGSDSNVLIDMAEELRWLEYGQRLAARSRNVMAPGADRSTGQAIFDAALAGGAQALGAPAGLAAGNAADVVSLDAGHPSLADRPAAAILDGFLFAAGRGAVDCVWRRGDKLVSGGRHIARDVVVTRYRKAIGALIA